MENKFKEIACCKAIYDDLINGKVIYDEIYKSLRYPNQRIFAYCPNCGAKLPYYSEEYADALEESLGKDLCDITDFEIPAEFRSDEWWKRRGITGIGKYWEMYDPIKLKDYD